MTLLAAIPMFFISNVAFAEADPVCPSGHAMYYLGSKSTTTAPKATLSWSAAGNSSTTYSFDSGLKLVLSFSDINFVRTGYPEVSSFTGVTTNALNMRHSSEKIDVNHRLTATINKPVTKYGFVVQDLDANAAGRYTESVSIVTTGGAFSNFANNFTVSNSNKTITANQWTNCSPTLPCNFNIEWDAQAANTPFITTHGNNYASASTTTSTGDHVVGYSDFYFCLAPPKLTVKKALSSTRVNTNDQFEIAVSGGSLAANSFTTTGTGSTITNGTSATLTLADSTSYTITERVMNGTTLGDIANYSATYTCSNATTGSTTSMPTSAMSYNSLAKTRSFTLNNATYGDDITCTITNNANYVFSGTVFNDNGNVLSPSKDDISSKYLNNSLYFNGKYDSPTESGIPFTTGHTITLNKCTGDSGTFSPQTVNIGNDGTYSFSLTAAQVGSYTRLCVTQNEPSNYTYSVDTTSNVLQIDITNSKYNYPSNDFGDVVQENAALVLIKSQYVHDCSLNNLATIGVNYDGSASSAYSTKPISNIIPGQCIAYRIEAINRGNVSLADIVIKDTLQIKNDSNNSSITSTLANPTPIGENSGIPSFATNSVSIGNNGTVTTNTFSLGATTATRRQAIRFNTKYGTTISN
ncbi:hypothetical protein [Psychrobacter sp. NPDC077938]|uniref:hypothetical protein n=1 Tax=Psychrobacter sp. NPDC077938 TaxID=3364494 RepID=UPI0037C90BD0